MSLSTFFIHGVEHISHLVHGKWDLIVLFNLHFPNYTLCCLSVQAYWPLEKCLFLPYLSFFVVVETSSRKQLKGLVWPTVWKSNPARLEWQERQTSCAASCGMSVCLLISAEPEVEKEEAWCPRDFSLGLCPSPSGGHSSFCGNALETSPKLYPTSAQSDEGGSLC